MEAGGIGAHFLLGLATGGTNVVKEVGRLAGLNNILSPSWRVCSGGYAETHGVVVNTERANEPTLLAWTFAPSRVGKGMAISEWRGQLEKKGQANFGVCYCRPTRKEGAQVV